MQKIADVLDQVAAEIDECDLPCSQHQHHAKQNQIHQVNHDEREKRTVVPQVGLVLGNHPAGEAEMECPRCADHRIEQSPVRLHVVKNAEHTENPNRKNAV